MLHVYQCEDSIEGVFTAVYRIYEDRNNKEDCRISLDEELYLFAEYIPVSADTERTRKVIRTLLRKFGEDDYLTICYALSSRDSEKADAVYHAVAYGLSHGTPPGRLFEHLSDPFIHKVFSLARAAGNECCHLRGFIRFQEMEEGFLFSRIGPKHNLLTFLMPHFADRFPMEHFVIYDEIRGLFGVHPGRREGLHTASYQPEMSWYLVQNGELEPGNLRISEREEEYQLLFKHFCQELTIESRRNPNLQRNLLPLRFREYMVEFDQA